MIREGLDKYQAIAILFLVLAITLYLHEAIILQSPFNISEVFDAKLHHEKLEVLFLLGAISLMVVRRKKKCAV